MTGQATAMTTIDDVVEFLKDQHKSIKELLPIVLQSNGSERDAAFATVRQTLAIHEAFEQVIVHPHARPDAGEDVVTERIDEEHEAGEAIAKLERLDVEDQDFHDAYAAFMLKVVEHAEHEEHEEFDRISHKFSQDELAQVERGVELTRRGLDASSSGLVFADMLENAKQDIAR